MGERLGEGRDVERPPAGPVEEGQQTLAERFAEQLAQELGIDLADSLGIAVELVGIQNSQASGESDEWTWTPKALLAWHEEIAQAVRRLGMDEPVG
jgi:hypothetical protein